jgi:hypothetical protein
VRRKEAELTNLLQQVLCWEEKLSNLKQDRTLARRAPWWKDTEGSKPEGRK